MYTTDKSTKKQWLSQFIAMSKKEFIVLTRYRLNFILSFFQVMFIFFIFLMAAYVLSPPDKLSYSTGLMFYSFMLFMFLSTALWDIGNSLRQEQYQGTLESLFMAPISYFSTLASRILSNTIWTGLNVIFAFYFVSIVFGTVNAVNVLMGILILILSIFVCFGFSFGFAGMALKWKESMNLLTNGLQFFFLIVCAMFFPFSALPEPVLYVSRLIPLSYCTDLFRSTLLGVTPELLPWIDEFIIVAGSAIIFPILGLSFFKKSIRDAKNEGNLAEY